MRKVLDYQIENTDCKVFISGHAFDRLHERFLDKKVRLPMYVVGNDIKMLGDKIVEHSKKSNEIAIIDKQHGFTMIVGLKYTNNHFKATIVSILDKTNAFIKRDTFVEYLPVVA